MKKNKLITITLTLLTVAFIYSCQKSDIITTDNDNKIASSIKTGTSVNIDKAKDIASIFMQQQTNEFTTKNNDNRALIDVIISNETSDTLMYVINYNEGGFVVVGATTNYYPILAYSNKGTFDFEHNNSSNNIWFNEIKTNISNSELLNDSIKQEMSNLWQYYDINQSNTPGELLTKASDEEMEIAFQQRIMELQQELGDQYSFYRLSEVFETGAFQDTEDAYEHYCDIADDLSSPLEYTLVVVYGGNTQELAGPLVSTSWGQHNNFNLYCDNYPDAAGCGVIAIAQSMKFYEYPESYDWDSMYNYTATLPSQLLIAEINRKYGNGMNITEAVSILNQFGYSASIVDHNSTSVRNEIYRNKRPVIMTGFYSDEDNGHGWICDGVNYQLYSSSYFIEFYTRQSYSSLDYGPSLENPNKITAGSPSQFFHMNWGWSGLDDGWYVSDNVSTSVENFQYRRKNIYFYPN